MLINSFKIDKYIFSLIWSPAKSNYSHFSAMVREVAEQEMTVVARELNLRSLLAVADQVVLDLYDEIANGELQKVAIETVRELHEERERRIQELLERQRLWKQRKYFSEWLKSAKKQRRQRDALLNFPSVPGSLCLEEQVRLVLNDNLGRLNICFDQP